MLLFNTNSYVYDEHHGSEKTFGWIQTYDTYKIAQQTESMSTFRNLVWHEFEIITRMPGPRFKSYNVHRIETSILSLVLCTFKCCF